MEVKTLGNALVRSCRTWPAKVAMHVPNKDGKGHSPLTYADLESAVRKYAFALRSLGVTRGKRICLQSENCVEWAFIDWACQSLGVILVPIYPTLPADQTQFIVKDSEAMLVICSSDEQRAKVQDLDVPAVLLAEVAAASENGSLDPDEWITEAGISGPEDLATIIYTSGTTGNPKGVMLPQRAPLHVCLMANTQVPLNHDDTFLTYLPMSHVFERVVGQWLPIYMGATIGFAKSLATLAGDIIAIKPTVLCCVPRFLEATMDKIVSGAHKQGGLSSRLFDLFYRQSLKKVDHEFAPLAGILDGVVGSKVREKLGGRIRYLVSGGAALPAHVARFYMAFGFEVLQGYGLTETSGGTFINRPGPNNKYWTVGESLGMDAKIAGDGEILVKGPGLFLGYLHLPEETAAAIDSEGWFHTGDIGEFEGQNLKITDRKKDLLVLANGKNIAPQLIENRLKEDPLIQEVVLFGDGSEFVYGLVLPNFEKLKSDLGITGQTDEEIIRRDDVKERVKASVTAVNRHLADFEKVKRHVLLWQPFSVETGELTPSLKVRRRVVRERYANLLAEMAR